jgi:hypothetical protein
MEQVALRVEILVDRAVRQICLFGDVGDRRCVKTIAREYFFRCHHDLFAPLQLVVVADRLASARPGSVAHRSTSSSSRPTASMNSETISNTTDAVGCTLFSEPTT